MRNVLLSIPIGLMIGALTGHLILRLWRPRWHPAPPSGRALAGMITIYAFAFVIIAWLS